MITDELADSFNGPDADEVCRRDGHWARTGAQLYDELVDQNDVELTRTHGAHVPRHDSDA